MFRCVVDAIGGCYFLPDSSFKSTVFLPWAMLAVKSDLRFKPMYWSEIMERISSSSIRPSDVLTLFPRRFVRRYVDGVISRHRSLLGGNLVTPVLDRSRHNGRRGSRLRSEHHVAVRDGIAVERHGSRHGSPVRESPPQPMKIKARKNVAKNIICFMVVSKNRRVGQHKRSQVRQQPNLRVTQQTSPSRSYNPVWPSLI